MNVQLLRNKDKHIIKNEQQIKRWMGLNLAVDFWWMKPIFGTEIKEIPSTLQLFIGVVDNGYIIVIPATNKENKGELVYENHYLILRSVYSNSNDEVIGVQVTEVTNIIDGIKLATQALAQEIEHFNLRETKNLPPYYDYFGWCTWDVFYREVSEQGVIDALDVFKEKRMMPYYMILDDGWQDVSDLHLNSIFENEKFPSRLSNLTKKAKDEYGIKQFGIWHALQGYWGGINPCGALAKSFSYVGNEQIKASPFTQYFTDQGYYMKEEEIGRFYEMFYKFLNDSGVDIVKVDSQGSLMHLCENHENPSSVMQAYQKALHDAGQMYFNQNVLYCMSHVNDVIFNTYDFVAWRNSDDFFPQKPLESQLEHFYINGLNNIFTSMFAYPDWDMFQTNHPQAELHSLIRAISGGPVYICDAPKDMNVELLNKLIIDGQQVLRFAQPALPFESCIINNPLDAKELFKVYNYSSFGFTMMAAHVAKDADVISDSITSKALQEKEWICFEPNLTQLHFVNDEVKMSLEYGEYKYLSFVEKLKDITPLGLIDKYNSYLVIKQFENSNHKAKISCMGQGQFACFVESHVDIQEIMVNGQTVSFTIEDQVLRFATVQGENDVVIKY